MIKQIPNVLTALNATTGAAGCYAVLKVDPAFGLYFVLIAGVFDLFDGLTARWLGASTAIGAELDSLADIVSFGVLPVLTLMAYTPLPHGWLWLAVVPFSALRLAVFNVSENKDEHFEGLPTPANALALTSITVLPSVAYLDTPWIIWVLVALSCWLLVTPIRLFNLKFKHLKWRGNEVRWIFLLLTLFGFLVFYWQFLPLIIPMYLVISVVWRVLFMKYK